MPSIATWVKAFLLTWLVLSAGVGQAAPEGTTLKISTGVFSPWADENARHKGFVSRVIEEAFRRRGYQVEFFFWPWKRALVAARNGKVDATSFWYKSEEKQKQFYYSEPISEHKEVFFYLKNRTLPEWHSLEDLSGLEIGATRGYTYTDEFWRLKQAGKLTVYEANSDELNFKKLLAGRIVLFPAAELVGWRVLKQLDPAASDKVTTLEKPLAKQYGHLLFAKESPQSKALVTEFNAGLKTMKEDGTLESYRKDLRKGIY